MHIEIRPSLPAQVDDIVAYRLPLAIAIRPYHQVVDISAVLFQVLDNFLRLLDWDLLQRNLVERFHVCLLPVLAVVGVLKAHYVAQHRGDPQSAFFPVHMIVKLKDGVEL